MHYVQSDRYMGIRHAMHRVVRGRIHIQAAAHRGSIYTGRSEGVSYIWAHIWACVCLYMGVCVCLALSLFAPHRAARGALKCGRV
jgi:hypothetical protein